MTTIEEPKQYASESCHAYDRQGNPRHEVPNVSKGGFRPTTLRDLKKNDWLPSVSAILNVIAKPGLSTWKVDQYLSEAYNMVPIEGEDKDGWISAVRSRSDTIMSLCRDTGTDIHGIIQSWLPLVMSGKYAQAPRGNDFVYAARDALIELDLWGLPCDFERTFACDLGYGGCTDLCGTGDHSFIVDWKVVDRLDKDKAHKERVAQLCGYSYGIYGDATLPRLVNVFLSSSEPGKYEIKEWDEKEKTKGWEIFKAANNLWRALNDHRP